MRTFLRRYLGIGELHIGPSQYVLNVVVACGIVFLIGGIFQQIYFYSILGFVVNVPMMMYIFYVSYKRLMDIVYGNDVTGEKAQFPYFVIILGFLWGYIPSVGIVWLSIASQLLFFFCFLFLSVFPSRKDTLHEKFSYRIILQYLGIGENFIDHDQYLRNLILTLPLLIFSFYGYGMTTFLVIMSGDGGVSFGMMIFFGVFFWILISYVSYLVYKRGVSKKRGEIKIPFWGFLPLLLPVGILGPGITMIVIPHIDFAVFFIFIYSFILLYHLLKRQSNKKETDVYVDTEGDPGLSSEKKKTQNVDEEIFGE